jgi:uncharacterized protein YegP (UPF0339 family)
MITLFKRKGKFEILKDRSGQFYFRLKSSNGQIILISESYKNLQGCENGIESVRINGEFEKNYDIRLSKDNKRYFVLKAVNGEIIGKGETYESLQSLIGGIKSCQFNSKTTVIQTI